MLLGKLGCYTTVSSRTKLRRSLTSTRQLSFTLGCSLIIQSLRLPRGVPYHLVVIFITEGDPGGGWWHTSMHGNQQDSSVREDQFLQSCLHSLHRFASQAVTARVFGVACGFNLRVDGSLALIKNYLQG
jgi:hypothetical protein